MNPNLLVPLIAGGFSPLSLSPIIWLSRFGPYYSDLGSTLVNVNGAPVRRDADQSGNGNNADAPTAGNVAKIDTYSLGGGIYLDGIGSQLNVNSGAYNLSNFTFVASVLPMGGHWTQAIFTAGNGTVGAIYADDNGVINVVGGPSNGGTLPLNQASTLSVVSRGSGSAIRVNGVQTATAAQMSGAVTGGIVGNWGNGTIFAQLCIGDLLVFPTGLADTQIALCEAFVAARSTYTNRYDPAVGLIGIHGNSITYGQAASNFNKVYASVAVNSRGQNRNYYKRGVPGLNTASMTGEVASYFPFYGGRTGPTAHVWWELTNSIFTGRTDVQTLSDAATYVSTVKGLQSGLKVITLDCLLRQAFNATQQGYVTSVNSGLSSLYPNSTADPLVWGDGSGNYLVKVSGISQLSDPSNTTYFPDGTHLSDAAHALIAPKVATALQLLGF